MTELHYLSATRLAALIRSRKIGCLELLEHFLARVERHNPAINAIVWMDAKAARKQARAADAALARGERRGPLHGLPMTVKEAYDIAGAPSTHGRPQWRDNIATGDSWVVSRLKAAGAVIFGKTNLPFAMADWQSFNEIHGTTRNPWNTDRVPGGVFGRLGRGAGRGADRGRSWQRHRLVDPQPGALHRHFRPEAELGRDFAARPCAAGLDRAARHCGGRADGAFSRRPGTAARCDGRPRPARRRRLETVAGQAAAEVDQGPAHRAEAGRCERRG
jgi:hypothetical protein